MRITRRFLFVFDWFLGTNLLCHFPLFPLREDKRSSLDHNFTQTNKNETIAVKTLLNMAATRPISSNWAIDQTLSGHKGSVHVAVYSTGGQHLLTGGQDRTIKLWNPVRGSLVKVYEGHGWEVLGIVTYEMPFSLLRLRE